MTPSDDPQVMADPKGTMDRAHVEHLPHVSGEQLPPDHRDFLLARHGTLQLTPLPSSDPRDPLNWPTWKKDIYLGLITFHAMMSTFGAAALVPAFEDLAKEYHRSVPTISYLVSSQILFNGIGPLFWRPIAERYGRRPVVLVSTFMSAMFNIAGGFCTSYGTQMVTRVLAAAFICPCAGIGGAVATELYFAHERARRIGWWTLTVSVGPPLGPLVMGWVVDRAGSDWVFWVLAMINFGQFLVYLALNAESKYPERHLSTSTSDDTPTSASWVKKQSRLSYPRLNGAPWTLRELYSCFLVLQHLDVAVVMFAVTVMFAFVNVSMILEIPHVLGEKFELTGGQIGLQCLGPIIGALIGEQVGGPLSDFIILRRFKRTGRHNYSSRLNLTHLAWPAAVAGTVTFYVQTQRAHKGEWNVTPLIGAGVAWFGSQILLTTMITFAVDSHREVASDITLLSNLTRHVWGFVSPFYFPPMFAALGFSWSGILMAVLMVVVCWCPTVLLHWSVRKRVWDY